MPAEPERFETADRLALSDFPAPAYERVPLKRYLIGSLQFSSGCPIAASSATSRSSTAASRD